MTAPTPILEYSLDRPQSRTLTLESTDSTVRVIFPVLPKWCYWLPIVGSAALGLLKFAIGIVIASVLYNVVSRGPANPDIVHLFHRYALEVIASASIGALFWWSVAAYSFLKYRRWGRAPRILTATNRTLTDSSLAFWSIRHRTWPTNQIKQIRFRPIKRNLNPKSTAADLYIDLQNKHWPKRFRLSSPNPELPSQIARQLASTLGCPLT